MSELAGMPHGTGDPPAPPTTVGDYWLDIATGAIWLATGTEWVEITDSTNETIKREHTMSEQTGPWQIGENYLIRTVTMTLTGQLSYVGEHELGLTDAAWIADTGRYANAVASGSFSEVEPYPDGKVVIVGRGAVIDAVTIDFDLPRTQL